MRRMLGLAALAALGAVACGGGDGGGEGDLAAYCDLVEETATNTEFPTADELQEYRDVAPAEVRGAVDTLADAFEGVDDPDDLDALIEALEEPEVAEAIEEIEAFDAENCDDGEDASGADDGEDASGADDGEDASGADDEETTTTSEAEAGSEEASTGTLCDEITDAEVSELVGVELSSAETLFNDEDNCSYESADGDAELFLGRLPDLGQRPQDFLSNAEINFDDFEELDGIGDVAYFITSEFSGAMAGAMEGGFVHSVTFDDGGNDPLANRDVVIELLEELLDA